MLLNFGQADKSLDRQIINSVVAMEIAYQLLWMEFENNLSMSKKILITGTIFTFVGVVY